MVPYKFGSSDGLFNLGSALAFAQTLAPGVYVASGSLQPGGGTSWELTIGGFAKVRAPERFSFPPVNIRSPPIAHVLGAMKSSCDLRSQAQVVRSKQPAY